MKVVIIGTDLPGRTFCRPDGSPLDDVHVGVQVKRDPAELVRADAASARWELDVNVVTTDDGAFDFRGPAVQGRRGERFVYLTWGNVPTPGEFEMFRRAKLMLDRIEARLVKQAVSTDRPLVATVRLTDHMGAPICARLEPPAIAWTVPPTTP